MGFIKSGLLIIVSILLLISFLAGNTFLTLTMSLEYENVKPELISVFEESLKGEFGVSIENINLTEEVEERLGAMREYCQNNSEYIFSEQEYTFVIPCDVVEKGPEAIVNKGVEEIIEKAYYEDYDCDFWDCLEKTESPLFLISEKARDYWQQKFYFALMIAIILIVLAFFLTGHKQNWPILVGGLLIVSSLPFMKLKPFLSFLDETYLQFLTIFVSKASIVFLGAFVLGLVLLGAGIVLHFVNLGNFIAEKIDRAKEKRVSKEEEKGISKKD